SGRPLIWVHAVSLGETRAAQPLMHSLRGAYPQHEFLVTHMTATGRQAARELYGNFAQHVFLPYDFPWAANRFLRHYRPVLGLIMETEIWPNLLRRAARLHIPVALVNARMSERSASGYARLGELACDAIATFDVVAAQTQADADRLEKFGAKNIHVTGNLKFDASGAAVPPNSFREWFKGRRTFLLASTRDGEEALILDAIALKELPSDVLMIIVPRHPQRFDDIAKMMNERGVAFSRRSAGMPKTADRFFLGDSMGEMPSYYACSDIAFIGGSLLPYGSQNLIEACAQGVPVILGPSVFNFKQAAESAIAEGAAIQIHDAGELLNTAVALLDDPGRRTRMKEAGLAFCAAHQGATARTMALIEKLLPPSYPPTSD
ncbi:MAG TPA: 3-deoxy-D-manno-octulosonic acid transferase, partial [Burkholderiales bacterium]|nr:3-deoxy-D-manno-octulosonic acid transferase [Burkholderiales bacterium]